MTLYRFLTTVDCHLSDGTTQTLRDYRVTVEADTAAQARSFVQEIALEQIADAGGDLLDAPVDEITVRKIEVAR